MASLSLDGAHVVVVGGSSGIGRAIVEAAVEAGAHVTVGSRSPDRLASVAAEFGKAVSTRTLDVTDEATVAEFFADLDAIDHLSVCPGSMAVGSVYDVSTADVHDCLNTKFLGQLFCVRYAGPKLSSNGSVVLTSGASGFRALAGFGVTGAANVAVAVLGRTLALELAPVRVNVVVPGMIDTPLWQRMPEYERIAMFETAAGQIPLGRIGRPSDVAAEVLHLFRSDYVTGSVVCVDGGSLL